jgi:hypothetical protein
MKKPADIEPRWMFDPLRPPEPSSARETVSRMLRNLAADFLALGDGRRSAEARRYELLVEGAGHR